MPRTHGINLVLFAICPAIWLGAAGISVAQTNFRQPTWEDLKPRQAQARPKSLLSWNLAEQSAETEASEEVDRIVTDRPHFSEASSLVGLGVTQIETGYSFFLN